MKSDESVKKIIVEYQQKMHELNIKRNNILSNFQHIIDAEVINKYSRVLANKHGET